jgi:ribosome biogenesis GTPase
MKALIYKSTGSWYIVKTEAGDLWQARIKGVFKIDDITSTNPLAVGDWVEIEPESNSGQVAIITEILTRRNYINRQSPRSRHQHHIIAANVDQSLLVATLREPKTSQGFIDRFLVASEAYHIPPVILFNKTDLYREKELELLGHWQGMYESIGYRVMALSMTTGQGLEQVRDCLKDKTTLISGHSGVGKSTLLNALMPDLSLKTQDVSGWSGKGLHTTTFAEMFDLPGGGKVIDTPGVREFGLVDIDSRELSHYFPEMRERLLQCQFNNCMHMNEPECAVKKAVIEGMIYEERYISYCAILDSLGPVKYS